MLARLNHVLLFRLSSRKFSLVVELWSNASEYLLLRYSRFAVGPREGGYVLSVGGFSAANATSKEAAAMDGMTPADGRTFGAKDKGVCKGKNKARSQ